MVRSRPSAALACLALLILLVGAARASGDPQPTRLAPAIGVPLNSGPGGEAQAFREFFATGADAIEAPQPWSTLEPGRGRFHLTDVASIVAGVESVPRMQVMLIPAAIETTERSVPAGLERAPWGGARMIDRYRRLIRHLAPHLSRQVRYVSIANEADVYLSAHPGQLPGFIRFAHAEIAELRRLVPWAKAGVTVTFAGLTSARPRIARSLARLGDTTIATYYPLRSGYRVRSPRAPLHDIPRLVRLAHGRPLVLQEVGYSSSPRLGSSPTAQAAFVRNVFAATARFPRVIPFLSFYTLFDLPASACRSHSEETTFFCSLGLHYCNGHPKPAWSAFRAGVKETLRTPSPASFNLREAARSQR